MLDHRCILLRHGIEFGNRLLDLHDSSFLLTEGRTHFGDKRADALDRVHRLGECEARCLKVVFTFVVGSRRAYDFLDGNEQCMSLPVDLTNLPAKVAENRNVVSINNCMQIDLSGQVASESSGHRHVSGTGGQLQFVRGAFMSEGGKSFICLSSRHKTRQGKEVSRIVPELAGGTVVTTPRTDVMYVVTEYGIVNLKGKSVSVSPLVVNIGLMVLFGLQHSVMARQSFKARWQRLVPPHLERTAYVVASCVALIVMMAYWRPMPVVVWESRSVVVWALCVALGVVGASVLMWATFLTDHFELFGLRRPTFTAGALGGHRYGSRRRRCTSSCVTR